MTTTTNNSRRGRPRIRFQPDVRITVRFRGGRDDDLLAWLDELPDRRRASSIREVLRQRLNGALTGGDCGEVIHSPVLDYRRGDGQVTVSKENS